MKAEALSDSALEKADEEAVIKHFLHGTTIDPEVSARVHARAQVITARLRATQGVIDAADRVPLEDHAVACDRFAKKPLLATSKGPQ